MTISFTKKPVYTVNGQDYETLEAAQLAAIGALDESFGDVIRQRIMDNADALTAIFRQSPRKNASPAKRKRAAKVVAAT